MVRAAGIEPALLSEPDFESGASTSSTTPAARSPIASRARDATACQAEVFRAPATILCSFECIASLPASTCRVADRLRTAAIVGDEAAGLAHQQAARGGVPRLEIAFPEPVVAARRHPGEIERGRAEAADARDLRPECVVDPGPFAESPCPPKGMPVAISASSRWRRAETRRRRSCSQAPRLFSAQKLSSVIG